MERHTLLTPAFGSDLEPAQINEMWDKFVAEQLKKNASLRPEDFANYSFKQVAKNIPGLCFQADNYRIECLNWEDSHEADVELAIFLSKIVNGLMTLEFGTDNWDGKFGYFVRPGSVIKICYDMINGDLVYEEKQECATE